MLSILLQILVHFSAISSLTLSTQTDFSLCNNTCCRAPLPRCITFQIKTILRLQFFLKKFVICFCLGSTNAIFPPWERLVLIKGLLCSPLKSGGFCGKSGCTSKGYVERLTSLTSLERKGGLIQGLLCSPLKSVVFMALLGAAPVRGMFKGKILSLCSREILLASQKWCFFALLGAPVRGM